MQFYPPGWVPWPAGHRLHATQWCAALNIDTFSENENTGEFNNTACLNTVGPEPVNFAFLTKNGRPPPRRTRAPRALRPQPHKDLLMNSGDNLTMHMFDTAKGCASSVADHTTRDHRLDDGQRGQRVRQRACSTRARRSARSPRYDFHPEFSTSTPLTRNVSAAHTYNVAFSDEIGHCEYCGKVGTDAHRHLPAAAGRRHQQP